MAKPHVHGAVHGEQVSDESLRCPICHSLVQRSLPARMAAFLRTRAEVHESVESFSNFCSKCEHIFFTPFLDNEQLAKLYAGYRDDCYTRERIAVEPEYADLAPLLHDNSSHLHDSRREYYRAHLAEFKDFEGIVVDFGGGDAYWSELVFPKAQVVVVEEGYERAGGDLPSLMASAGFFFATHTFEHIAHPTEVLSRLAGMLRPGTHVFIELPKEYSGQLQEAFLGYEQALRAGQPLPGVGPLVMHEHLAHFSDNSLRRLLDLSQIDIVRMCSNDSTTAALGIRRA